MQSIIMSWERSDLYRIRPKGGDRAISAASNADYRFQIYCFVLKLEGLSQRPNWAKFSISDWYGTLENNKFRNLAANDAWEILCASEHFDQQSHRCQLYRRDASFRPLPRNHDWDQSISKPSPNNIIFILSNLMNCIIIIGTRSSHIFSHYTGPRRPRQTMQDQGTLTDGIGSLHSRTIHVILTFVNTTRLRVCGSPLTSRQTGVANYRIIIIYSQQTVHTKINKLINFR